MAEFVRRMRGDQPRLDEVSPPLRLNIPSDVLRTQRLVLRPLTIDDRAAFIDAVRQSRRHLQDFSPLHMPEESDDSLFERQLRLTRMGTASGTALRRAVFTRDGVLAGACNLNAVSRGLTNAADVNWWIAATHVRRGYAAEALRAVLDHALTDVPGGLGLDQVHAHIQRDNTASIALALRVGFVIKPGARSYLQTGNRWSLHDLWVRTR